ncbi:LamG-like jellyroll fold domain-containing protein [Candidatus Poribacteria bacterium]
MLVLDWLSHRMFLVGILVFIFLPFCSAARDVPLSPAGGEALDLRGVKHGYYYAVDENDSFDNEFLKNGMTIEFWFYPARQTERGEIWGLISKSSLYWLRMEHLYLTAENNDGQEANVMWIKEGARGGWSTLVFWDITGDGDYEPEWHHIAFQGRLFGNRLSSRVYQDGILEQSGSSSATPLVYDTDTPLFVGGAPEGTKSFLHDGSMLYTVSDVTTFNGLIDELRISSVERYKQAAMHGKIDVKDRFQPDEHTVALWHFDEGPRSVVYQDASGNDHGLFAAGELGIDLRSSVPILWGTIKSQAK